VDPGSRKENAPKKSHFPRKMPVYGPSVHHINGVFAADIMVPALLPAVLCGFA
jgi:hypothetical protein